MQTGKVNEIIQGVYHGLIQINSEVDMLGGHSVEHVNDRLRREMNS